jgi:hypothetical protein
MRYFVNFRHSDTGLTPVFTYFKKASDLTNQAAPGSIVEVGNGRYYFDRDMVVNNYDVVWELDGGASIPTEEIRYISGSCSPNDDFVTLLGNDITNSTTAVNAHTDSVASTLTTTINAVTTNVNAHTDANDATLTATIGGVGTSVSGVNDMMVRALGMLHENSFLDMTSYDTNNNFTGGRLRIYDTKAHANAAVRDEAATVGVNGLLSIYIIAANYLGVNLKDYRVTRDS